MTALTSESDDLEPNGETTDVVDRLLAFGPLLTALATASAERLRLHPADHLALSHLISHGPMTAGQLAERMGLTTGAITGTVDRLEDAGYVGRMPDEHDRRRVIVSAAPGLSLREIDPVRTLLAAAWSEQLTPYSAAECAAMLDFLERAFRTGQEHLAALRASASSPRRPRNPV